MKITFHRGGKEIGGNCIEIESKNERIILDIGKPILSEDLSGCIAENSFFDGVLLSHAHLDHYGLLDRLSKDTKVFISAATRDIFEVNQIFLRQEKFNVDYGIFESYKPFRIGSSFQVIPFLQDHSAFDSHGFVIKAEEKTIVYTGDFRNHGRKPFIYQKLIELLRGEGCNLLITEGTTTSRPNGKTMSEELLVNDLFSAVSQVPGLVMVCFSSQNIDRLVSIYKTARKAGRIFVIDIYTAYLLSKLQHYARIPTADYRGVRIFYPKRQIKNLLQMQKRNILNDLKERRIFLDEVRTNSKKYILTVRPSLLEEFEGLENSLLIYSMWQGYLKNAEMTKMVEWFLKNRGQYKHIHTTGHASAEFLKAFIEGVNHQMLKIIHTEGISDKHWLLMKYSKCVVDNGEVLII